MDDTRIEPHKITKPIQLLAVWMSGLVLIVGSFISGAIFINEPSWLPPTLGIATFIIVITFAVLIFIMQTKFRPELQEDPYYSEYLRRQNEQFKGFRPENIDVVSVGSPSTAKKDESWEEREKRRIEMYEKSEGLFLVHSWRPSHTEGQVADITISLYQHGEGPLSEGEVESVEYHLGPKFFEEPISKTNAEDNFRLDVSAYGPMLCLARVSFNGGAPPIDLERYINF